MVRKPHPGQEATEYAYPKNNSLLYQFLSTFRSNKQVSIDTFTLLLQVTIGIDLQCTIPQPIDRPIGIVNRLLPRVWL